MNEWIGIGNLTKDPELGYTQSQTAKCTFTLAINRPRRNGEDAGADYIRIITWGKQAETCGRYLARGSKCAVRGEIRTGSYKNREGQTVYTTDIWATNVEFLSRAESRQQNQPQGGYQQGGYQPQPQSYAQPQSYQEPPRNTQQQSFMGFDDMPDTFQAAEDDIPF